MSQESGSSAPESTDDSSESKKYDRYFNRFFDKTQRDEHAHDRRNTNNNPDRSTTSSGKTKQNKESNQNHHSAPGSGRKANQNSHQQQSKTQSEKTVTIDFNSENMYRRLGLENSATEKEIKAAYRKLALKYHPDKNREAGSDVTFKAFTEAYSILSDPVIIVLFEILSSVILMLCLLYINRLLNANTI
jgi:hypothetical protein